MNSFTIEVNLPIRDSMWTFWIFVIHLENETRPISRVSVGGVAPNPVRQRGVGGGLHCKVCIASRLSVDWSVVDVVTSSVGEGS